MTITTDLPEDVASQIERLAAREGQDVKGYVSHLAEREVRVASSANGIEDKQAAMDALIDAACRRPVPRSLDDISPRNPPHTGRTAMEMIRGQWPGNETTEELLAQLASLDENDPDVENIRL